MSTYIQHIADEVIYSQINLVRAKIEAVENNLYKISEPVEIRDFDTIKEEFRTISMDWDAYDSAPQYDRVFYCFLWDMIHWLDRRLDLMGLLDETQVQHQFEIAENRRGIVESMFDLIPTDEDDDPIGTILNMGYQEALEAVDALEEE